MSKQIAVMTLKEAVDSLQRALTLLDAKDAEIRYLNNLNLELREQREQFKEMAAKLMVKKSDERQRLRDMPCCSDLIH
ncbi:MAG: hypothetical protein LAP86_06580 [Acidobacteriia bacterium]|nr:hypothetical protein [Terriglobia bacterium]